MKTLSLSNSGYTDRISLSAWFGLPVLNAKAWPASKSFVIASRFSFEIVDMDGNKIDKLLVTDLGPQDIIEEDED